MEELQHIFPEGEKWCTGEETLQMVIWSPTPDIYFKDINYITYLIHIYSWPTAGCSDILQELTNFPCRLSHNSSWVAVINQRIRTSDGY